MFVSLNLRSHLQRHGNDDGKGVQRCWHRPDRAIGGDVRIEFLQTDTYQNANSGTLVKNSR